MDFTYVNPGSVSIPKADMPLSFIIPEDGLMVWKDLAGGEFMRETI